MAPLRLRTLTLATLVRALGITLIILGILAYALFQARFFIEGPEITLTSPQNELQNEQVIEISGQAKNITEITLNGKTIHTDEEGFFTEALVLPNGYTIMTLSAEDRYGRKASVSRTLIYQPTS